MGKKRRIKKQGIEISDHAVMRYVQRVMGVDISKLKEEIVPEGHQLLISQLGGTGSFPVDGYILKVKNNVVVTIYADEPK